MEEEKSSKSQRKINKKFLVAGIILLIIGLGSITYATFPYFKYTATQSDTTNISKIVYPTKLTEEKPEMYSEDAVINNELPTDNRLVIPKIGVDIEIIEGEDESALQSGAWRHPNTAIPGEKGNIAISSHRFQFLPPNVRTLYLLDKMELGDDMIVYWEGKEFNYMIDEIVEVNPDAVEYIEKGNEEKLTVYTCTPLFTQEKRLVVTAKINENQYE